MSAAKLDPGLHHPARLQIAAALARVDDIEFATLRDILEVSDSVMSKHLSALATVGYVRLAKNTLEGRQRTWVAFTPAGKKAFAAHMDALRNLIASAEGAVMAS